MQEHSISGGLFRIPAKRRFEFRFHLTKADEDIEKYEH